jgi:hypothetical protein
MSDLKELYVGITRAKTRMFFYDDKNISEIIENLD